MRCNVKRIFATLHSLYRAHKETMRAIDRSHVLPLRKINFAPSLPMKPLPCILSGRDFRAVRVNGEPQMGGMGRRKEETRDLQVSSRAIPPLSLMGAARQHCKVGKD